MESATSHGIVNVLFQLFVSKLDNPPAFLAQQMLVMTPGTDELILCMGLSTTNPANYPGPL